MGAFGRLLNWLNDRLTDFLNRPIQDFELPAVCSVDQLGALLQPGDVLLVEGNLRISRMIKYITQSMWTHVALYVGPQPGAQGGDPLVLVEADLEKGVILSPLSKYVNSHTRICRPIGLRPEDRELVVSHVLGRVGHGYDLKNVLDLARERILRTSIAATLKRGLQALGSGKPTLTICSTLI
jgi:Permuted papain-like amidase enzyme, YaeF/YiiX, C92 family